jgi:tRNA 2-thiouridine synthesizing protein D
MKFSILVLAAPYSSQGSYSAYRFTEAALHAGHQIQRVFFYQDGIHSTTQLATPPQDEFDLYRAWQDLQRTHALDCVTCIAAAARRGVIDDGERRRHNRKHSNLAPGFELGGLGQLVEAMHDSDRLITFGT